MTPDLILRPSDLVPGRPWALELRYHGPVETEYVTLCRLTDEYAREVAAAVGDEVWLFGKPKIGGPA